MPLSIDRVKVKGFLSSLDFEVKFDTEINFIIGLNGTGKTTLINLIRACVECDSIAVLGVQFQSIEIRFNNSEGRNKPILHVRKPDGPLGSTSVINYEFREKAKQQPLIGRFISDRHSSMSMPQWFAVPGRSLQSEQGIDEIRAQMPQTIWLSIYRGPMSRNVAIGQEEVGPIDRKINDIVVQATEYLSSLDKAYSNLLESFQQKYFTSLLSGASSNINDVYSYNLDAEKDGIKEIASELFKNPRSHNASINSHFSRAEKAISEYRNTQRLSYYDAITMGDTIRLHRLVGDWHLLQERKREIYLQKTRFEQVMSDLLVNKILRFNSRNQPSIESSGPLGSRVIDLKSLSSGEKQLFIMFGSVLLQERRNVIFFADEPELSLHIEWQRVLVDSLRSLNENAQLVFATHSPDIVAQYSTKVISMEKFVPRRD